MFKKKTIFDYISDGELNDEALAKRLKVWLADKKIPVASRALKLYDKQPPEKKSLFEKHGLNQKFIEKHRRRINGGK